MLLLLLWCCVSTMHKSPSNPQKEVTTIIQKAPCINCNHSECKTNEQQPSRMSTYPKVKTVARKLFLGLLVSFFRSIQVQGAQAAQGSRMNQLYSHLILLGRVWIC